MSNGEQKHKSIESTHVRQAFGGHFEDDFRLSETDTQSISTFLNTTTDINRRPLNPETVLSMQSVLGNRATQQLVTRQPGQVQRKDISTSVSGLRMMQLARLNKSDKGKFETFLQDSNVYKRVRFGDGLDTPTKNFNYTLIRKMLQSNGMGIDRVEHAAELIANAKGEAVEVALPDTTVDPLARYSEFVEVQAGVSIDNLSDADEWKKFILNGIALEGYNSGLVDMTTVEIKKDDDTGKETRTPKTLFSGLQHRTQKATNRSVWYKWSGNKVSIYALANHIQNDNTKYRRISSVDKFLNSWKLTSGEAKPL